MSDAGDPCNMCGGLSEHRDSCFHHNSPCRSCGGITHSDCYGSPSTPTEREPDHYDDLVFELKKTLKLWDEGVINRLELSGGIATAVNAFKAKLEQQIGSLGDS